MEVGTFDSVRSGLGLAESGGTNPFEASPYNSDPTS